MQTQAVSTWDRALNLLWIGAVGVLAMLTVWQLYSELSPTRKDTNTVRTVLIAPQWLREDCPFDPDLCFVAIPESRNAAPLYIAASNTFYPWGPGTSALDEMQRREVQLRHDAIINLGVRLENGPDAVATEEFAEIVSANREGLTKLREAQQRLECVFETGFSLESQLWHVANMSAAWTLLTIEAIHALRQEELLTAIECYQRLLRLARDMQPRSQGMALMVAETQEEKAFHRILLPLLTHPKLREAECIRLMDTLREHRRQSGDDVERALLGQYVQYRQTYHDAESRTGIFAEENDEAAFYYADLISGLLKRTPKEVARDRKALDRILTALQREPTNRKRFEWIESRARLIRSPFPGVEPSASSYAMIVEAGRRRQLYQSAAECLTALQIARLESPDSGVELEQACAPAGLTAVPSDPYADAPMRFARLGSEDILYSVGPDGKDDRGEIAVTAESYRKWRGDCLKSPPPSGDCRFLVRVDE